MPTNPARLVYGTITVGALLAGESASTETYPETVASVVIALVVYWLAHSYAEFTARRLERGEPLKARTLALSMVHELPVLIGAAVPLLTLLVWWVTGASLASAISAGISTAAAMIVVTEVISGRGAGLTGRDLIAQALLGALLGVMVIALKIVLH